jgi:hypothetical protein
MTRDECQKIRKVLKGIKNPDGEVELAIAIIDKQLAYYNSMKGQLKEQWYDYESAVW